MASEDGGFTVEVRSKFGTDSDRARAAAEDLLLDLRREFGSDLPEPPEGEGGSKGDPVTVGAVILALISSGAVVKALDVVKDWIGQEPEDREIKLEGEIDGKRVHLTVGAKNVADETFRQVLADTFEAAKAD